MWLLCLQAGILVTGLYALITAKLPLTYQWGIEGRRARITGAILLLPVPIYVLYVVGFLIAVWLSPQPADLQPHAEVLDIPVTFGTLALAGAYLWLSRSRDKGTA